MEHPDIVDHFEFFIEKVADFIFDPAKIKTAIKNEGYAQDFVDKICDEELLCEWFITINEAMNLVLTPFN